MEAERSETAPPGANLAGDGGGRGGMRVERVRARKSLGDERK